MDWIVKQVLAQYCDKVQEHLVTPREEILEFLSLEVSRRCGRNNVPKAPLDGKLWWAIGPARERVEFLLAEVSVLTEEEKLRAEVKELKACIHARDAGLRRRHEELQKREKSSSLKGRCR